MGRVYKGTALALAGIIILLCMSYIQEPYKETLATNAKVIIIDPGHGGVDPGKVGKYNVLESHINLSVALKLRGILQEGGAIVFMTREIDTGLYTERSRTLREKKREDLANRIKLANEVGGLMMISLHCNSFGGSKWHGAQTFYLTGSIKGESLAKSIQKELIRVVDPTNTRVAKSNNELYILKNGIDPTVIVEMGFLSNPTETQKLQEESYQEKLAWAIYIGILKYLSQSQESGSR